MILIFVEQGFETWECHQDNVNKLIENLSVILNNADPYPFVENLLIPLKIHEKLTTLVSIVSMENHETVRLINISFKLRKQTCWIQWWKYHTTVLKRDISTVLNCLQDL